MEYVNLLELGHLAPSYIFLPGDEIQLCVSERTLQPGLIRLNFTREMASSSESRNFSSVFVDIGLSAGKTRPSERLLMKQ